MCRFALYLGPPITLDMLIARPAHSIIRQSFRSHLTVEPLNGDGFGIAWYVPDISPEPAAYRSIQPAWNNRNLRDVARLTRSGAILAHVRAASPGSDVSEANCHPFTAGSFSFMHNGAVADFLRLKRKFQERLSDEVFARLRGTTDSEHIFGLFQGYFEASGAAAGAQRLAGALAATIAEVVHLASGPGPTRETVLNLAVCDGRCAVVSRYVSGASEGPSLFWHVGRQFVYQDGACRMLDPETHHDAVVVASEPLTEEPGWHPVPRNHMILVAPGGPPDFCALP